MSILRLLQICSQRYGHVNICFDHLHYEVLGIIKFAQVDVLWESATKKIYPNAFWWFS